jgi:hypothetical protein
MNKLLAEALSILNGFFALILIIAGGIAGMSLGPFYAQEYGVAPDEIHADLIGLICGLVVGFFSAVVLCGLVALLIQMHRELKTIRDLLREEPPAPPNRDGRRSRIVMPEAGEMPPRTPGS